MMKRQFICGCYLHRNIFLRKYKLHVHFVNEDQFRTDYKQVLASKGLKEDLNDVVEEVKQIVQRRQLNGDHSCTRKVFVEKNYVPLHKDVYRLQESFLHPDFLKIVQLCEEGSTSSVLREIQTCKAPRVYSFPVFTEEFCKKFMEELNHFEKSDIPNKGRPSNMNMSGLLLYELGFYPDFFDVLREKYVMPLAGVLFPDWVGAGLDSQRAFVVSYKYEECEDDTDLALHFDNAEVTLNVSLTDHFEGGELFFSGMRQESHKPYTRVDHKKTQGILHRGQHFHGAMPIDFGERHNLIIWMRSSSIRNQQCPRCDERPTLVETPGEGDGFTLNAEN